MSDYHFETPQPVRLYTEIGKGRVQVTATDTMESAIVLHGPVAAEVSVTQDGNQISVIAPRQRTGFFGGESELEVIASVPTDSDAFVKTSSADIRLVGTFAGCVLRSGSGEVEVDALGTPSQVETGSGDIAVDTAGAELRVKSGSGDVQIRHAAAATAVSTGSGDVRIRTARGPASVKTGSGDLLIEDAYDDVSLATGSGDLVVATAHRGRVSIRGASGDVVVGIPTGVPVWTDIYSLSGDIRSSLASTGEPAEGTEHIEIRAKTVSGDIVLRQV